MKKSIITQKKSLSSIEKRLSPDQMENLVAGAVARQCFLMGLLTFAAAGIGATAFLGAAMYTTQNCA